MITDHDKSILALLVRSTDRGDGWRNVSPACQRLVDAFSEPELLEIDAEKSRVRLTHQGAIVAKYLL